jgi:kynurenine formamidase
MTQKLMVSGIAVAGAVALAMGIFSTSVRGQGNASPAGGQVTAEEFDRVFKKNNNWGRWGKDDALGTINLVTDAKRKQAASLVKTGIAVSVAHDLSTAETPDNPAGRFKQEVAPNFRVDTYFFQYHGTFVTHQDALCHYNYNDRVYNDRPLNTKACIPDIHNLKDGIVTRGILIDIPKLKGVEWLEPQTRIYPKDIEAWEKMAGVKISSGDAIILRTGRWARRAKLGPEKVLGNSAGFDLSVAPWMRARDVALAGGDVSVEAQTTPPFVEGQTTPLHTFFIVGLGMPIIDDFDAEALAETAARLHRWEFMLVVAPLRVPGGTGSPVNPIAIF